MATAWSLKRRWFITEVKGHYLLFSRLGFRLGRVALRIVLLHRPCVGLTQLGFDFLHGGETRLECLGQGAGQSVARDADRFPEIPQGVLGHEVVAVLAEDEADGRLVFRRLHLLVEGGEVEVELAGVFPA